ncbi:MAG: ABC transporter ATP-binding protein, partial [Planctomycetota bacterium]
MLLLSQVRKSFGSLVAVDDLSLEIERGEVFGLLGPNGAGKSTTVNLSVGLLRPDRGEVRLNGYGRPDEPRVRARVGVAPQKLAIYENLTGAENVRFFGRMYGLRGSELSRRTDEALEFVGLNDRRRDRAETYSGGMKR